MRLHKNPICITTDILTKEELEMLVEVLQIDIPSNTKAIVYYSNSDGALCFNIEVLKRIYDVKDSLDEFMDIVIHNKMKRIVGLNAE